MIPKMHAQDISPWWRWALPLRDWRNLVVAAMLLATIVVSAALIYFQPGTRTFASADAAPLDVAAETSAPLPPGTEVYYLLGSAPPARPAALNYDYRSATFLEIFAGEAAAPELFCG